MPRCRTDSRSTNPAEHCADGVFARLEHVGDIIGVVGDALAVFRVSRVEPVVAHPLAVDVHLINALRRDVHSRRSNLLVCGELGAQHGGGTVARVCVGNDAVLPAVDRDGVVLVHGDTVEALEDLIGCAGRRIKQGVFVVVRVGQLDVFKHSLLAGCRSKADRVEVGEAVVVVRSAERIELTAVVDLGPVDGAGDLIDVRKGVDLDRVLGVRIFRVDHVAQADGEVGFSRIVFHSLTLCGHTDHIDIEDGGRRVGDVDFIFEIVFAAFAPFVEVLVV